MINRNVFVDLPTEKTIYTKPNAKGIRYVSYLVESSSEGRKTANNKRVNIGIVLPGQNKLCPNANYYKYFKTQIVALHHPKEIRSFGSFYLLYSLSLSNNLLDHLESVFPDIYKEIFTIACFMLIEGNLMYYVEDYCDMSYTINDIELTPNTIANLFKKITEFKTNKFFAQWITKTKEKRCIAFESSSIASYSNDLGNAEYKDDLGEIKLQTINLNLYFGQESQMPLFYDEYNDSLTDIERLISMQNYAKSYNINKLSYVLDQKYFKQDNIKYLSDKKIPYIMDVSLSHQEIKNDFETLEIKKTANPNFSLNYTSKDIVLFGKTVTLHIYFDFQKEAEEIEAIEETIQQTEIELNEISQKINAIPSDERKHLNLIDKLKIYEKYFSISILKDNTFSFKKCFNKIEEKKKYCGYFGLISSRVNIDSSEDLLKYRYKSSSVYDNLKNSEEYRQLRYYSNEVMRGKVFVTFICSILKQLIENKLQQVNSNLSVIKLLKELSKIKLIKLQNDDYLLHKLTEKQKEYLLYFNISENDLKKELDSLFY